MLIRFVTAETGAMERMLKPMEVADVLRLSRTRVYAMLASGAIPSIRIGGSIRVSADGLREWLAVQAERTKPVR